MPQFVLDNFDNQNTFAVENPAKQPHYLLSGVNPYYAKKTLMVQEEQAAPLAASSAKVLVKNFGGGNPVLAMIPSQDSSYLAMGVEATSGASNVFAINSGGAYQSILTGLGSVFDAQIEFYAGKLLMSSSGLSSIVNINYTGGSSTTLGTMTASIKHYLKNFKGYCAYVDGSSSSDIGHLINLVTSSFTTTTGIDLGKTWGVVGPMVNYNNKYLAIPAAYNAQASSPFGYVFLWDGFSPTYNTAVQMPGQYVDMVTANGILYLLTQSSPGTFTLYQFNGTTFREIMDFCYNTAFGLAVNGTDRIIKTASGLVFVTPDPKQKDEFTFCSDSSSAITYVVVGTNGLLYKADSNLIYSYNIASVGSSAYNPINYTSQYLSPENANKASVNWVKVYYDTPPVIANDTITVVLYTDDSDQAAGTLANASYVLSTISTTNAGSKYVLLDAAGSAFNKLKIQLVTAYGGGTTWFPIIRKVVVDYTSLNIEN